MLKILSNINNCVRWDVDCGSTDWPMVSGVTGSFVGFDASGATRPIAAKATAQVWSEGNRDGSAGFSPDTKSTGKLTVIAGSYRALTDQFNSCTVNEPLKIDNLGRLTDATVGTDHVVAYCTKASHAITKSVNGVQSNVNVIEYVTL